MSSILFPKGHYKHLERNSDLARHLYFECRNGHGRELGLDNVLLSEFLFNLNADAYKFAYGHHTETADDIRDCSDGTIDLEAIAEDEIFGQVTDWNSIPQIWEVLRRIQYQCEEFPQGHAAHNRLDILNWMIENAVKMQMEKIGQAVKHGSLLPVFYRYNV